MPLGAEARGAARQNGDVISLDLAHRLKAVGVEWTPAPGDHFHVPDRDLDETVFVVSDMVVQVLELPSRQQYFAFNGTTEWALDSIEAEEVVWLPREDQLRTLLGDSFSRLEVVPGGFVVTTSREGVEERHVDITAETAYARALLSVLG
jgi:hypothetical protein